tara:strand:+ start:7922 stop:8671 length:750 start_codon:yes stop_codon:yes gene_type:complete
MEDEYSVKPVKLIQNPDNVKRLSKEISRNLKQQSLYTINYLASGKGFNKKDLALGKNEFIKMGKCDDELSSKECRGMDRYVYLRNIPTGTIPPVNMSFYNVTGCNLEGLTEGRGLIPGLIEDVYDINPVELTIGSLGKGNLGSDVCKKMTLPVGSRIYDKKNEGKRWKWDTKCTSSFRSMTETTDDTINKKIKKRNPTLKNARLPGPYQLRENFTQIPLYKKKRYISFWLTMMSIFAFSIVFMRMIYMK